MDAAYLCIIFFISFMVAIISHYWVNSYYKSSKYTVFLKLLQVLASSLFSIAITIQIISYYEQQNSSTITGYGEQSKFFLDDILNIFINHPEMNYYYEELLGIKKKDAISRYFYEIKKYYEILKK